MNDKEEIEGAGGWSGLRATDLADAGQAMRSAVDFLGSVDILVYLAGVRSFDPARGTTRLFEIYSVAWDFVMAVNVRAPFLMIQEVGAHMIGHGRGGRIVNLSSMAAYQSANGSIH